MKRFALGALLLISGGLASAQTVPQRAVVAANSALAAASRTSQPARLAGLRTSDSTEGSRVTITSDVTLTEFRAYTEGNRFFLLIPYSTAPVIQNGLSGRGFTDATAERRGEDVLLSFGLEEGASASVHQRFNRLEISFTAVKGAATPTPSATPAPTPTPLPSPSSSPATATTNSSLEAVKESDAKSKSTVSPQPSNPTPGVPVKVSGITLPAEKANPIQVTRFEKPPVIDGKLDDDIWKTAVVLKDFYQISPGDNTPPSKPTEVMMGYDARFLYFAFHCFDEPDKVRATVAKRDNVFDEDNVRIYLDTFNDQRRAYLLGWNPLGV
ncbi:MAG TPA: hypothetical protein VEV81_00560, partial [Pyrinomonadaceae bacterium]|nr:hypothetical protein [Pyrinomonadaceae bacterium]